MRSPGWVRSKTFVLRLRLITIRRKDRNQMFDEEITQSDERVHYAALREINNGILFPHSLLRVTIVPVLLSSSVSFS